MPRILHWILIAPFLGIINAQSTLMVPTPSFPTISSAILAASSGDTILVSAGAYSDSIDFLSKTLVIESVAGPAVTTIVGSTGNSVVKITGQQGPTSKLIGFTIRSGSGAPGDAGGITIRSSSPEIRRCRVYGNAGGNGGSSGGGAGGILLDNSNATVIECEIFSNSGGTTNSSPYNIGAGGIHVKGGSPLIAECFIYDNAAGTFSPANHRGRAGGVHLEAGSTALIRNCTVSSNIGTSTLSASGAGAGGIHATDASPTIDSCFIANNTGGLDGDTSQNGVPSAGGISSTQNSNVTVRNSVIVGNQGGDSSNFSNGNSRGGGGGIHVQNGSATVTGTELRSNRGGAGNRFGGGGGVAVYMGTVQLQDCRLVENEGGGPENLIGSGGALTCEQSTVSAVNSRLEGNIGGYYGIGTPNPASRGSGGIFSAASTLTLDHCVIANCVGGGPADIASAIDVFFGGSTTIRHCTIYGNIGSGSGSAAIQARGTASVSIASSIVWGNQPSGISAAPTASLTVTSSISPSAFPGSVAFDPQLVAPSAQDYSPSPTSPAVDMGASLAQTPALDQLGGARRVDGNLDGVAEVDIGAIEFNPVTLYCPPEAAAGSIGRIRVHSTSGSPLFGGIIVGAAGAPLEVAPFGALMFDTSLPFIVFGGSLPIPFSFPFTIPPTAGIEAVFTVQGFGFALAPPFVGQFTRAALLTIGASKTVSLGASDFAPEVSVISPSQGIILGGTSVTIHGDRFEATSRVKFGGQYAMNAIVVNSTLISCETPPGFTGGPVSISVDNSAGQTRRSAAFNYVDSLKIIAVSPLSTTPGSQVTVSGYGFNSGTSLTIDGTAATVVSRSLTELVFLAPAVVSCNATIAVTNSGIETATAQFNLPPIIQNHFGSSGSAAGGSLSTLTGDNFFPGTTVRVGGNPVTSIPLQGQFLLTFVVPPGSPGPAVVEVIGPLGCIATSTFTYL
ncbi:MAG: IPT/TIG domain-containing protein [Planctomycetes bacterium]|nr:IPT/TIG domain-containing protein [Planctomycetota bacterium]